MSNLIEDSKKTLVSKSSAEHTNAGRLQRWERKKAQANPTRPQLRFDEFKIMLERLALGITETADDLEIQEPT